MVTKEQLFKCEKRGWILIGEIDWEGEWSPFSPYKWDSGPVFLYSKISILEDKVEYHYGFGLNILDPTYLGFWMIYDKRYSINTILTDFISNDIVYESNTVGRPIRKSENLKIRLVGSNWIYPDKDLLENKITIDEVEIKFRSTREKELLEAYKNNPYATKEDIENFKIYV